MMFILFYFILFLIKKINNYRVQLLLERVNIYLYKYKKKIVYNK